MSKSAMEFAFDLACQFDGGLRVYQHANEKEFVIEDYREGYGSGATAEEAALSFIRSRLAHLKRRIINDEDRLAKLQAEKDQILEAYPQFEDVVE